MDADAARGRVLLEESRESVVVLDDEDRVLAASRRARQSIHGLEEGRAGDQAVQNRAGRFTTPGLRGITQAVSTLPKKITSPAQLKIVDPSKAAGPLAYPIATFTYVILPTNTAKAAELRTFVYWAVTQGQKVGPPLFFVPLPTSVKAYAYREQRSGGTGGSGRAAFGRQASLGVTRRRTTVSIVLPTAIGGSSPGS